MGIARRPGAADASEVTPTARSERAGIEVTRLSPLTLYGIQSEPR